MMYSEFVAGTGCKENDYNYEVFKRLEVMYMNTDMSKDEIYEYGKKLVDNSKSEEQIKFEEEIKAEIENLKREIEWVKISEVERYEEYIKSETDPYWKKLYMGYLKDAKETIKKARNEIKALKWVLGL